MFGAGYFGGGREASDLDEAVFDHGGESMYLSDSPDGSHTHLSDDVSAASGSPFADDTFSVSDSPFAMDSPEHDGIDGGDDGLVAPAGGGFEYPGYGLRPAAALSGDEGLVAATESDDDCVVEFPPEAARRLHHGERADWVGKDGPLARPQPDGWKQILRGQPEQKKP
eukprot:COSAG06_NODE_24833_length_651_cov_1.213768_2_plen_167_part_01